MSRAKERILLQQSTRVYGGQRSPSVEQLLLACGDRPGRVAMESLCGRGTYGRYSLVSFDPVSILRCHPTDRESPFDKLDAWFIRHVPVEPAIDLPFVGGWIGYLSYEAGRRLERLPCRAVRDLELPDAWFGLYDTVAIFDHALRRWHVVGVEFPADLAPGRPPLAERLDHLESIIGQAADLDPPVVKIAPAPLGNQDRARSDYIQNARRVLEYIRAGDIYQANLTVRLAVPVSNSAVDLYRRLRLENPADYMAYIDCGDHQVLCSSPELFLHVENGEVLSRPIKGTRPRSPDPAEDAALSSALRASEKDLAELAMIVDVERNDLGRVCQAVEVDWPPTVESYATVHHLVADVRGRIGQPKPAPPELGLPISAEPPANSSSDVVGGSDVGGWVPHARTPIDILRATFPGGSITGAPKIRAMEIIDELEPVARGPYCGSIGYIGLDGRLAMNIAIRTMILKDRHAYVHAGAGIVADSNPESEYDETMAKARGMLRALGVAIDLTTD